MRISACLGLAVALATLGGSPRTFAAEEADFARDVVPLLETYCISCHGAKRAKADLDLESRRDPAGVLADGPVWNRVLRMVSEHEMPPGKSKQPSNAERQIILDGVRAELAKLDCSAQVDPGRPTLRRLNELEYENTIRDLVGVEFQADFPDDEIGFGFDNIGDVLSLPPLLLEKYLDAAVEILDAAVLEDGPAVLRPTRIQAETLKMSGDDARPVGGAAGLFRNVELKTRARFPAAGVYSLRARAHGDQFGDEFARLGLSIDGKQVADIDVSARSNRPEVYETRVRVEPGERRIGIAYLNNLVDNDNPNPRLRGDRNLFVDWVEFELVEPDERPEVPASHARIFPTAPSSAASREEQLESAREVIAAFARRAFRRPLRDGEVERLLSLTEDALEAGDGYYSAVRLALEAILVSPQFLFRVEIDPAESASEEVRPLNDHELASRLSYYLWSSLPDERLFSLADAGKLSAPEVLAAEARRLLADPRSRAFVESFGGQWLQLRHLETVRPDPARFPGFDETLRRDLGRETLLFFESVLKEGGSIVDLLDADYTYLNERLARHYGIDGVTGDEMRRVSVAGTPRGGVLTHASVLTVTSNPTRTSPVKRGLWILERILGAPPPPPPPDVPALEETEAAIASGSMRERFAQHRANPNCAICHDKMDALGFAFENFDAVGAWREFDGSFLVEAGGVLPDGRAFEGPGELKTILVAEREAFARALAEKVLTYALGRGLDHPDECAIRHLVERARADEYRLSTLVLAVVESEPFRNRRTR